VDGVLLIGVVVPRSSSVSMWEQLSLAAFLQRYWADNQVSCTITFDPVSEGSQLSGALDVFQYQLKGASFLPRLASGAYPQMPYEEIDEARYTAMVREAVMCGAVVVVGPRVFE
jgi:ribonucleoside-triphosphate reductase (thioredoxin)